MTTRVNDGWYVAEPDGEAWGPMSRDQMAAYHARGVFGEYAQAWHVDLAEWQPVARAAAAGKHGANCPPHAPQSAPARAQAATHAAHEARPAKPEQPRLSKAERKRLAKEAQAKRDGSRDADDGKRLMSHPQDPAAVAAAKAAAALAGHGGGAVAKPGGAAPSAADEAQRNGERFVSGVRRVLARLVDWFTLGMAGGAALWALAAYLGAQSGTELTAPDPYALFVLGSIALVPLETLLLATVGGTPGKILLGVRVRDAAGGKPGLGTSARRAFGVALAGVVFGILFFTVIAAIVAIVRLINKGETAWDARTNLVTETLPIDAKRWQMGLVVTILGVMSLSSGFWPEFAMDVLAALLSGRM